MKTSSVVPPSVSEESGIRIASVTDVEAVVATVTSAFLNDPLWAPTFAKAESPQIAGSQLWRLFVSSAALRYPWTFMTSNAEAAAVWYPPGAQEFTDAEAAGFDDFLVSIVGRAQADEIQEITRLCDDAHPVEPSFYLSLLATHQDHRGHGFGMAVLRESLNVIDRAGMPAYLESSNPSNDARYASVGFEPLKTLTAASGHRFTTMWRPSR